MGLGLLTEAENVSVAAEQASIEEAAAPAAADATSSSSTIYDGIDSVPMSDSEALANGELGQASPVARIPGKPFGTEKLEQLKTYLSTFKVNIEFDETFLNNKGWNGAFRYRDNGTATIFLRNDPSEYEVWHELGHAFDWIDAVTEYGPSSAFKLTLGIDETAARLASEQSAYQFLRNSTLWNQLSVLEQNHTILYIKSFGGIP